MNKKAVHINVTANWGSTGKICEAICILASSSGWESYIAYGRHHIPGQTKVISIGSAFDTWKHLLATRLFDRHGLSSKSATKTLIETLKYINPNIIHLHNIHGYFVNYPLLFEYIKQYDIPVVWTLHDCWPFTGHCAHFDEIGCRKWIEGCNHCPYLESYPESLFADRSEKNWKTKKDIISTYPNITFVPVSHWIDGFLKQSFFHNHKSQVIHNGIDLATFSPIDGAKEIITQQYGINPNKHIILGVANIWDDRKGFNDVLKLSRHLDPNRFTIIIIGVSKSQLKELPTNITGIQRTTNQTELATLYSAADIYINPTYSDTYPTTNLESIACGTPVITYRTGGSPESITDETGCIVNRGDISKLRNTIVDFCNSGKALTLSDSCRRYASAHFDRNKCFSKYLALYDSLISHTSY